MTVSTCIFPTGCVYAALFTRQVVSRGSRSSQCDFDTHGRLHQLSPTPYSKKGVLHHNEAVDSGIARLHTDVHLARQLVLSTADLTCQNPQGSQSSPSSQSPLSTIASPPAPAPLPSFRLAIRFPRTQRQSHRKPCQNMSFVPSLPFHQPKPGRMKCQDGLLNLPLHRGANHFRLYLTI